MKKLLLFSSVLIMCYSSKAQVTDTVIITGEELVPVEGRGTTPDKLEGRWVLKSGLKATNREKSKDVHKPKPKPGTEVSRSSTTSTETVNGVTTTTTETEVRQVMEQGKQITPAQGDRMHTQAPPSISFFGENHTFSGYTGCNKFAGRYSTNGNKLNIKSAAASTQMECIGDYDEKDFMNKIRRVNGYRILNGKLELLRGNEILLVMARR